MKIKMLSFHADRGNFKIKTVSSGQKIRSCVKSV